MHVHIVTLILLLLLLPYVSLGKISNAIDKLALLSFKSALSDPTGALASWNTSNHLCRWRGVKCGRRHPERVVALSMASFDLSGPISPSLGNLLFLRSLDLHNNQLHGQMPQELGYLRRLHMLNLSSNSLEGSIPASLAGCLELRKIYLTNNLLEGKIPAEIGTLKNLVELSLFNNNLSGEIPESFANLSSITFMRLTRNSLSGQIPFFLGNLSTLQHLYLSLNALSGRIPSSLGQLSSLRGLSLGWNNLSGTLPSSIWNISSLTYFHVSENNNLSGGIPLDVGTTLRNLQFLYMSSNSFYGNLPASLGNASGLWQIELGKNFFNGTIPPQIGKLQNLQKLQLNDNLLQVKQDRDWSFMTALTNCTKLQYLYLDSNSFNGARLPTSVVNLSTSLRQLTLSHAGVSGNIPTGIRKLINLELLDVSENNLTGSIPSSLGMLQNLQHLVLFSNDFSGNIPFSLGNLTRLNKLYLHRNTFVGSIPGTLGNLKSLLALDLSANKLSGTIPKELVSISTISLVFNISYNFLEGPIPFEVGHLQNLMEFDAQENRLSGQIPASFGQCQVLQYLCLQKNLLQGSFPLSLSGLQGIELLDLSKNNLSGEIPKFLEDFRTLYCLNLSFNNFDGEVPTGGAFANASAISVQGNDNLCGGIQGLHLPRCSLHKFPVVAAIFPLAVAILCLVLFVCFFLGGRKKMISTNWHSMTPSLSGHAMISYAELVKATDGFSITNLLGVGSFGSVYKGKLGDGGDDDTKLVAVKVLNLQTPGALKSFTTECEAVRNLRHRNLIKVRTSCLSIDLKGDDFRAIVFDFMSNGSLEGWLHPEASKQPKYLDLLQRVNIAFDVASALDYLHHHGAATVIHCDLKPSNVLLDDDMVAHVGDFGLAKILIEENSSSQQSISSIRIKGTIGYAAPEYGMGNRVSMQGDIYSYGILVLEMVTGKRPTDFQDGLGLHEYVEMALPERAMDIVDTCLVTELEDGEAPKQIESASAITRKKIQCIIALLRIGLWCSEMLPINRMTTKDIIEVLHAVKEVLTRR